MSTDVKQTAIAAVKSGLSPVLLRPNSKRPYGNKWATIRWDEESIEKTCGDNPDVGLGIRLGDLGDGRGLIDVDVDGSIFESV